MPYLKTQDGTDLYVKDWGSGRPVVLIHGWPLNADSWEPQAIALAEAGYRAIAYDRRGFGRSGQPWGGHDYDTYADDLKAVLEAAGATEGVALVGFSMGGGEIARYMSRHGGAGVTHAALVGSVVPGIVQSDANPHGVPEAQLAEIAGQITKDRAKFFQGFFRDFYGVGLVSHPVSDAFLQDSWNVAMQASLHATLEAAKATAAVDAAFAGTGPDTVAKFLFTSGTTGSPKAVIQTQRMLCANQEMVADCYAFFRDEPPVVVDWAPWNHTPSGNKVFNLTLYNGGSYYIDRGKPTPALMGQTIANLRDVAPTWYFNVPAGYEMLVGAMRDDAGLRRNFFSRLKMLMYAGAGLAQHTWDDLVELSEATTGRSVPMGT
ncbi:MAG TPA: hypothetical protein DEP91_11005, partial [Sphingomonas bacterium]|nr:hypothetical protein [Sphingomonas bacterium]